MELNKIYNMDNLAFLQKLPDDSIHLTITSPPYNLDIGYDTYNDSRTYKSYLDWLKTLLTELYRVTVKGGRVCINVGTSLDENKKAQPLQMDIVNFMREIGWEHRAEIIWNKNQITSRTAWGSWKSPSNNKILPPFEYIEVFHKESPKLEGDKSKADITKEEFIEYTNALWNINPASAKKIGHPVPFPDELAYRLIKMYSYQGNTVLDIFNGSGTTTKMAHLLNRNYLGVDISDTYCELAEKRLQESFKTKSGILLEPNNKLNMALLESELEGNKDKDSQDKSLTSEKFSEEENKEDLEKENQLTLF